MTTDILVLGREPVPALIELARPRLRGHGTIRTPMRCGFDTANAAILGAVRGDVLVGSVTVGFDGYRGWVRYLAVASDMRGRGMGRALMTAAGNGCVTSAVPRIQLMVRDDNAAAIGFYETTRLERRPVVTFGRFLEGMA